MLSQADYFQKFVEGLKPDDLTNEKANNAIAAIFNKLDENEKPGNGNELSIDRRIVAGSAGKRTTLPGSDYDLVIFLNEERPPFDAVLKKLKEKLSGLTGFKFEKFTKFSLQFQLNGLDFDLLPAVNFRAGTTGKIAGSDDPQFVEALKMAMKFDKMRKYGSSLAEFAVEFVEKQTPRMHDVIRMAKFWNQLVDLQGAYVSGRSNIIELIAIGANVNSKGEEIEGSVMNGFTQFLLSMVQFNSLDIKFFKNYEAGDVDSEVMKQRPLILDPSNPNNNLAFGMKPDIIKIYEDSARLTLAKINRVGAPEKDIESLIDPKPKKS